MRLNLNEAVGPAIEHPVSAATSRYFRDYENGHLELFVETRGTSSQRIGESIEISGYSWPPPVSSISPNGRYVVVLAGMKDVPESWRAYADEFVAANAGKQFRDQLSPVSRYELIDTGTGDAQALLNAPVTFPFSQLAWSPDSRSVIVTDTFLPFEDTQGNEREQRRSHMFTVEINISDRSVTKVSEDDLSKLTLVGWDAGGQLVFKAGPVSTTPQPGIKVVFHRGRDGWHKVEPAQPTTSLPRVVIEEDINTPPKLFAEDSVTGRKVMLLEFNPGFSNLKFGRVEDVRIRGTDGYELNAGFYYPFDYVPGQKYPLVIQTHGWQHAELKTTRFYVNGYSTTANAAQPLAGKNIIVLQLNDIHAAFDRHIGDTPEDGPQAVATYQSAIAYLDKRGLIDPQRVGIIGFSWTCYYVKYTLTHSKLRFAAASVTDGLDGGYLGYMQLVASAPEVAREQEELNGTAPYGAGLRVWVERSPGFNLDQLHTPLLMMPLRPSSLLNEYEWFAGLTRLGRPVEMIVLENGRHALEKPWDRMVSLQTNVDWFCFWLKGEEDPDPTKAEQYTRWRELRKLQQQNSTKPQASPERVN